MTNQLKWIKNGFDYIASCEYGEYRIEMVPGTGIYKVTLAIDSMYKQDLGLHTFERATEKAEQSLLLKQAIHKGGSSVFQQQEEYLL